MKTVLVTGANGYIGRHVIRSLKGHDVRIIGLDKMFSSNPGIDQLIEADFLKSDFDIKKYLNEIPDVCLHLAWRNGFNHDSHTHMGDLSGHVLFLDKLMNQGLKQLAVMGTMHEIGYWEGTINESTPCNPLTHYGVAKDALRKAMLISASKRNVCLQWLRAFYIYGDDINSQSIFGKITRAALEGKTIFPFTSGLNKYDFIRVEDLAEQIVACILQDRVTGIINCCSGVPVSLSEKVEEFIMENGFEIELEYGAFPDRPYDSPAIWGDATKIKTILELLK